MHAHVAFVAAALTWLTLAHSLLQVTATEHDIEAEQQHQPGAILSPPNAGPAMHTYTINANMNANANMDQKRGNNAKAGACQELETWATIASQLWQKSAAAPAGDAAADGNRSSSSSSSSMLHPSFVSRLAAKYQHAPLAQLPGFKKSLVFLYKDKDGQPLPIHNMFQFCGLPKNGSSRWLRLLRRIMGYDNYLTMKPFYRTATVSHINFTGTKVDNGLTYAGDLNSTKFMLDLLGTLDLDRTRMHGQQPQQQSQLPVLRFAVVRDPYERLLSGYLDKIAYQNDGTRNKQSKQFNEWCPHQDFARDFDVFVACLLHMYSHFDGCSVQFCSHVDAHIRPQVCCSMKAGGCSFAKVKYDFLLTVHDINDWYDSLVGCLGINEFVKDYYEPGKNFWQGHTTNTVGSHTTAAAAKAAAFYKNSSTVDAVRRIYAEDLLFCSPHSKAQGWCSPPV